MSSPENPFGRPPIRWAAAASLLVHGLALFLPLAPPPSEEGPTRLLQATLGPPAKAHPALPPAAAEAPRAPAEAAAAWPKPARRPLLTGPSRRTPAAPSPRWSAAQKQEMQDFMAELAGKAASAPQLAPQALAEAREAGRHTARREQPGLETLELRPDAPPVDPFSLEMYIDSLLKKLNRSAAFVRSDPRARGLRTASVQIRLNPDGSLKTFEILDAGDQAAEIAFVRSVVEQAVPFSPFPADIRRSAQSLAMVICIQPTGFGGGGFGFSRHAGGSGC